MEPWTFTLLWALGTTKGAGGEAGEAGPVGLLPEPGKLLYQYAFHPLTSRLVYPGAGGQAASAYFTDGKTGPEKRAAAQGPQPSRRRFNVTDVQMKNRASTPGESSSPSHEHTFERGRRAKDVQGAVSPR